MTTAFRIGVEESGAKLGEDIDSQDGRVEAPPPMAASGIGMGAGAITASGYTWGVGLTPRLFQALTNDGKATLRAQESKFVPIVRNHVQSVEPSRQVMSQYWVPVIIEREDGHRHVLHVDPIAVRRFRRSIAEELKHVQEKRRRFLKRIQDIRQSLPETHPHIVAERLTREIASAEAKTDDPLLKPLPRTTRVLHVLVEASPRTFQLGLVCERLLQELPAALEEAEVQYVTLTALVARGAADVAPKPVQEPLLVADAEGLEAMGEWVQSLASATEQLTRQVGRGAKAKGSGASDLKLAPVLKKLAAANGLGSDASPGGGGSTILLVTSSPPVDAEAAALSVRRKSLVVQAVGVFGCCSEDPEPDLQHLVDAGGLGSSLNLYFGPEYWTRYAATQTQRLEACKEKAKKAEPDPVENPFDAEEDIGEVIDPKVFEMRLIERLMRECYVEEQRCEEELKCATRVLHRTAVPSEEVISVLQGRSTAVRESPPPLENGAVPA